MSRKPQRLELTWYNKDMALIPTEEGKYGYTWVDPSDPRYCETRTLVMDEYIEGKQQPKEEGRTYSERADFEPTTDNLLINGESGDVLEALTRIPELAEKYIGKVKLIYIDPPFNTDQIFAHYEDNLEHSIWLTLMRDRLLHLKRLLSDDGSIWVHLDDGEVHRMRLLMDEVFGATNFVAEVIWQNAYSPKSNGGSISTGTDWLLVYKKTNAFEVNRLPRSADMDSRYKNPDRDPRGCWTNDNPCANHNPGKRQHPGVYGIQHPVTGEMLYPPQSANWRFAQETVLELMREWGDYTFGNLSETEILKRQDIEGPGVEIREDVKPLVIKNWSKADKQYALDRLKAGAWPVYWLTKDGYGGIRRKSYLTEVALRIPVNLWLYEEVGHNDGAKKEIQALFPGVTPFSTPKPERLLERIIHIGSNPGDIVLDVFAGSGTTAAVAHKMGRRWVTCELLEDTFTRFTKARLIKVVNGEDQGGITMSPAERVAADGVELPEGMTPDDAQKLTSLLNKVLKDNEELKKDKSIKQVKALVKTVKTPEIINWRGGGGFQVAHLGPQCFDYSERLDQVVLTESATGNVLIKSVAANLGFELLPPDNDTIFHAKRGRMFLKVHEGIADMENASVWLANLREGETLLIAATGVADGLGKFLRQHAKGSRVIAIPEDIFRYTYEDHTEEV